MAKTDEPTLPCGFGGTVRSWSELLPAEGLLRLPGPGAADGVGPNLPPGPHAAIFVSGLRESHGRVERCCEQLAGALLQDGQLFLDVANLQAPRQLRQALEGKLAALEPFGSVDDPEVAVLPRRLLRALHHAGLWIEDCYQVPAPAGEVGAGFGAALMAQGYFAPAWFAKPVAARLWLRCRRSAQAAGSVLLGPGDAAARAHTRSALDAFLPPGWEIVMAEGGREPIAFDRALVRARGELLWYLRAGAEPDRALFDALLARVPLSPAAPDCAHAGSHPGDVSGLLLSRVDRLLVGPFQPQWRSDRIGYEEFHLRLEALVRPVHPVQRGLASPPPATDPAEAAEASHLLQRWQLLQAAPSAAEPAPACAPATAPAAPRISLCMIAKNEERFLDECLRRAAPAVDEIVLVDTGSTDRTVEIAQRHGAMVLRTEWTDDFSAPRNLGLEAATGDWILVLDADEWLAADGATRIRELVRDESVCGWHLRFDNIYTNHRSVGVLMVRLFRRLPGVRYGNRIHEQVTPSLQAAGAERGQRLAVGDVTVEHHGYTDEVMSSKNKNERNDRLFKLHLTAQPDDLYMLYKYGDFLRRMPERLDEARAALQAAYALLEAAPPASVLGIPYAGEIAALLALEYARLDQRALAEAVVETALLRFVPTPNLHYIAASLALHGRRPDAAIAHFERCLDYRDQVLVVPIQEGIDSWVSLAGIAQAWIQKGDRAKARRLLVQALARNPGYEVAVLALAGLHADGGDPAAALGLLAGFLAEHPDSPAACQQTCAILARTGHGLQARRIGQRAVELLERRGLRLEADRVKTAIASIR